MYFQTHSESDTLNFARRLSPMLTPGDAVLLFGELGAGKSVMARGIARGMGVEGPMPSPTFTLLAPYVGADGRKLYHFDLYRLNSPEEYYAAGLDEFVGGDGIAVVEWPQKAEIQPTPALEIDLFRCADEQTRLIEIQNYDVAGFDPDALSEWRTEA